MQNLCNGKFVAVPTSGEGAVLVKWSPSSDHPIPASGCRAEFSVVVSVILACMPALVVLA